MPALQTAAVVVVRALVVPNTKVCLMRNILLLGMYLTSISMALWKQTAN